MTNQNNKFSSSIDAIIYMKSGERKYGILIDHPNGDLCQFISNSEVDIKGLGPIQELSCSMIEAIDIDLK